MTTLLMILVGVAVGVVVGLMNHTSEMDGKSMPGPKKPKKVSRREKDDFWDYAWS